MFSCNYVKYSSTKSFSVSSLLNACLFVWLSPGLPLLLLSPNRNNTQWSIWGLLTAFVCRHVQNWEVPSFPTFPWLVNAASEASLPVDGALQSYLTQKRNIHKHGDISGRQDAVLRSVRLIFISPLGCWNKFVDSSSSAAAALHSAAKQRIFHNRSIRGSGRRRWRRRRGSAAASGRS